MGQRNCWRRAKDVSKCDWYMKLHNIRWSWLMCMRTRVRTHFDSIFKIFFCIIYKRSIFAHNKTESNWTELTHISIWIIRINWKFVCCTNWIDVYISMEFNCNQFIYCMTNQLKSMRGNSKILKKLLNEIFFWRMERAAINLTILTIYTKTKMWEILR